MSGIGSASGHLVNRSTIVRQYCIPSELGKGPIRSTFKDLNLPVGRGGDLKGDFVDFRSLAGEALVHEKFDVLLHSWPHISLLNQILSHLHSSVC